MKLTTKGRYAVMAMADLATNENLKPISLSEISIRQNISLSYLEQLFVKLKNNHLVKSVRGPHGGYVLEKKAKDIKLSSIIFAVNEEVKTLNCKMISRFRSTPLELAPTSGEVSTECCVILYLAPLTAFPTVRYNADFLNNLIISGLML